MPYVRNSYIGWSEEWFDNGDPKVNEIFIKYFVNRYFDLPEDWDDDDVPLIMVWLRCITCGYVSEHFMRETEEAWEDFIYNWDNTYTSLPSPECGTCKNPNSYSLNIQDERRKIVEDEYTSTFLYEGDEKNIQFESAIEEYFWKVWRTTFHDIALIPLYPIDNYRVDFAHISTKTVIELDGKLFHSAPHRIARDEIRQANIEKQGWRFIRFKGGDVYYHVDKCVVETAFFLSKVDSRLTNEVQFAWQSSPSARLLKQLQKRYGNDFMGDIP